MAIGRYRNPPELRDEDKRGFFTKIQWLWILIGVIVAFAVYSSFKTAGASVLAVIAGIIILLFFVIFGCVSIPSSQYLAGGGYPIRVLIPRLIALRLRRRLYTGGLGGDRQ